MMRYTAGLKQIMHRAGQHIYYLHWNHWRRYLCRRYACTIATYLKDKTIMFSCCRCCLVPVNQYHGPTPESNWVIPGRLLVGAFPASSDDTETLYLLTAILKEKVNKFVCLQNEFRPTGVTEPMWRSGQALRPYFDDVEHIVRNRYHYGDLWKDMATLEQLSFVHFPIEDCGVTNDDDVIELAKSLAMSLQNGEILYIHCWGGHGRTGTIVCILLHLLYGLEGLAALQRCQEVHDLRQCAIDVQSPQTLLQRQQVRRIIWRLARLQQPPTPLRLRARSTENVPTSKHAKYNTCSNNAIKDPCATTSISTAEYVSCEDVSTRTANHVAPSKPTGFMSFTLSKSFPFLSLLHRAPQPEPELVGIST